MHDQHFNLLKCSYLLLPKKENAQQVGNYMPISLSHSAAKLISKMLATRLSAELDTLISRAQSAFIKRRSIQYMIIFYTHRTSAGSHKSLGEIAREKTQSRMARAGICR